MQKGEGERGGGGKREMGVGRGGGREEEEEDEELCIKTKSNYYSISHFFKLNPTHHTEVALQ